MEAAHRSSLNSSLASYQTGNGATKGHRHVSSVDASSSNSAMITTAIKQDHLSKSDRSTIQKVKPMDGLGGDQYVLGKFKLPSSSLDNIVEKYLAPQAPVHEVDQRPVILHTGSAGSDLLNESTQES